MTGARLVIMDAATVREQDRDPLRGVVGAAPADADQHRGSNRLRDFHRGLERMHWCMRQYPIEHADQASAKRRLDPSHDIGTGAYVRPADDQGTLGMPALEHRA